MLIGELARRSGLSRDTIRYYEKRGLLSPPERRAGGYKEYPEEAAERLVRIGQLQTIGFTLREIQELFSFGEDGGDLCGSVLPPKLERKIACLDERIRLMQEHRNQLVAVLQACGPDCSSEADLPQCLCVPPRVQLAS